MGLADISLTAAMRTNLFSLQKTSGEISRTQERLSTGKKVNSALDNPTNFFTAIGHLNRTNDLASRKDGMSEAVRTGEAANAGLKAITSLISSAKGLQQAALSAGPKERDSLSIQYNEVLRQLDYLTADSGYSGTNLINNQSLTVNFNEDASSKLTISGVDATTTALGLGKAVNSRYWGNVTTMSSGFYSPLVIKTDGSVFAWDNSASGQTPVPSAITPPAVTSIAKGDLHSLALRADGSVVAWGDNTFGQATVPASAQSGVIAIAAMAQTSYALKSDGSVVAWGKTPTVAAAAMSDVVSITGDMASNSAFALKSDGSVLNITTGATPVNAGSGVVSISVATTFTLALKSDSSVVAWDNATSMPLSIPSFAQNDVAAIAAGTGYSMVLKRDGTVHVWNSTTNADVTSMIPPTAQSGVVAISGKYWDFLALTSDGTVIQWDSNTGGERSPPLYNPGSPQSGVTIPKELSWQLDEGLRRSGVQLDAALSAIRTDAEALSASLSIITIRQDFTSQIMNTLQTGSDNLTLADMNEQGANMLMLQTRQSLGTTSLSMAAQASQAVTRLF